MSNFNFDKTRPILVIDDCPMYRTATQGMLLKFGFNQKQIHLAHDAKIALQKCVTQNFQLVMCDYNLGDAKNGHQLIDELQEKKLLAADCILLIVTGDASSDVVRGFAELSPDGYMVKPLSYSTFSKRLPRIGKQKTSLSTLLTSFANEQFSESLNFAEEAIFLGQDVAFNAQIIKAKTLLKLGKMNDARNLLITLRKSSNSAQVILLLAEVFILQRHYQYSEQLLTPLIAEPAYKTAALHLLASQYFDQHHFSQSFEAISESVKASPKNIQRHKIKTLIALADFQIEEAADAIKTTKLRVQNSFRNTLEIHQLNAMICLDQLQFCEVKDKKIHSDRFMLLCKTWRSQFSQSQYKPIELIAMTRFYTLRGMHKKAKLLISEYHSWLSVNPEYPEQAISLIELSKTQLLLELSQAYQFTSQSITTLLQGKKGLQEQALNFYYARWCNQVECNNSEADELKKQATKLIKEEYYERSVSLLVRALTLNSNNLDTLALLHSNLTEAWPKSWSKQEVRSLALYCFEQLRRSDIAQTKAFILNNQRLSKQLRLVKSVA
jgi:DNA-binding NarL/FixJ family response regulator